MLRGLQPPLLLAACAALLASSAQAQPRPLPLQQTHYRLRAGEQILLSAPPESIALARGTKTQVLDTRGHEMRGFVFRLAENRNALFLTAALTTPPGTYQLTLSVTQETGATFHAATSVVLDPMTPVPATATQPPVVLLNGFQLALTPTCQPSTTTPHSAETFGSLQTQLLAAGVPVVYFFDNCVEAPDAKIEDIGNALAQVMNLIVDTNGNPVQQIDLVGHSMGGLIARAYLSGLQSNGSLAPPASPRVRKLILIASPNFGSFLVGEAASLLSTQGDEMSPGSPFLWSLNRWNQFSDDLRGVDALAIVGNAGPLASNQPNASDGVLALTSGSLGFTRDTAHTRILPYCHTDIPTVFQAIVGCSAGGIANADEAPQTAQIVLSYLTGTSAWSSIGTTPDKDPVLSVDGGVDYALEDAADTQLYTDLSQVAWGTTALANANGNPVFFDDLVTAGTNNFQSTSASAGQTTCSGAVVPPGYYSQYRCKFGAQIVSVGPILANMGGANTAAKLVPSGAAITITGSGFGTQCATCTVTASSSGGPVALQVSAWTDGSITAQLPATFNGLTPIAVQAAASADSINIMAAAPPAPTLITTITNGASGASGPIAPGEIITIKGTGLGPAAGVRFSVDPTTGKVDTTLAGVQVTIGGVPAPITYASAGQINAIVPYEIAGQTQVALTVQYQGASSTAQPLPVAAAAPGAFTLNSTGSGQAVAANQDGSLNGPSSPAPKGSYLVIYFTGGGQTVPAGATGSVNSLTILKQLQNVTATVGGQPATVTFAGAAPGLVDGVGQLNIQLPANIATGNALPLVISVNGIASPPTATLAVQ